LVLARKGHRVLRVLAAACIVFAALYAYFYFVATTAGADDVFKCKAMVNSVVSAVRVPESVSSPGQPAVFCDREIGDLLLRPIEHIRVYGIMDSKDQDAVLNAVELARVKLNVRRVLVEFYEKENWKTWADASTGNRGGQRGPETPIRRAVVEQRRGAD